MSPVPVIAHSSHLATPVPAGSLSAPTCRPTWVYLWRRAIVLAALACLMWGVLWGVFQIGGLVGARLVAPALGTAPVPVVTEPQVGS